jgi:hypothetical protein
LPVPLPFWLPALLVAGLILSVTGRMRPVHDRLFRT